MTDTGGARAELGPALQKLRRAAREPSDQKVADLATKILREDHENRVKDARKRAKQRGVEVPEAPPPGDVTRESVNDWRSSRKIPSSPERLLAVVRALESLEKGRSRVSLSLATRQWWVDLYEAAKAAKARRESTDRAAASTVPEVAPRGQLLSEVTDPFALEVHEAITTAAEVPVLPPYVRRAHDDRVATVVGEVLEGNSRTVVLLGDSSTGKTRALWEAVQPLRAAGDGWRLWHPEPSSRSQELIEQLHHVAPHTVVWLNETQRFFAAVDPGERDRLAERFRELTSAPQRGPILLVGTLWHIHYNNLCGDPGSATSKLLRPATIVVPEAFTGQDLSAMRVAAEGDPRLAQACEHAEVGRVTQYMAGGPELVHFYETAGSSEKALIEAAMDAVRLGHDRVLPAAFLRDAAIAYIDPVTGDGLDDTWFDTALARTGKQCKGARGPITRVHGPITRVRGRPFEQRPHQDPDHVTGHASEVEYQLADYLDQHGRTLRAEVFPPTGFWQAAAAHTQLDQQNTRECCTDR